MVRVGSSSSRRRRKHPSSKGAAGQHAGAYGRAAAGDLGGDDNADAGQVRDHALRVVAHLAQIDGDDSLSQRVPSVHKTYA